MRALSFPALAVTTVIMMACSNSDGPTSIELEIDELRIVSGACAMPEGGTCQVEAQALSNGVPVSNPVLRWSSSNNTIASVDGNGRSALVRGLAVGSARVTVSDTTERVSDDVSVSVLPCSKC